MLPFYHCARRGAQQNPNARNATKSLRPLPANWSAYRLINTIFPRCYSNTSPQLKVYVNLGIKVGRSKKTRGVWIVLMNISLREPWSSMNWMKRWGSRTILSKYSVTSCRDNKDIWKVHRMFTLTWNTAPKTLFSLYVYYHSRMVTLYHTNQMSVAPSWAQLTASFQKNFKRRCRPLWRIALKACIEQQDLAQKNCIGACDQFWLLRGGWVEFRKIAHDFISVRHLHGNESVKS